jgi:hypothetical protein
MSAVLEERDLENSAVAVRDEVIVLKIIDQATYDLAADKFRAAADIEKQIKDHHAPLKKKAHETHKAICDAETKLLKPVVEAKSFLSRIIGEWDAEQERVRLLEQRRLEEQARQLAEEEALASAIDAEQNGADAEEIEAVLSSSAPVQKVTAAPTYNKSVSTRENWNAQVVSLRELVKAAAANPAYLCYLQANETALNAAARAQKSIFAVPGCKAVFQRNAIRGRQ